MAKKYNGRNKMGGAYRLKCECGAEAVGLKGHVDHQHKRCPHKVRGRWKTNS